MSTYELDDALVKGWLANPGGLDHQLREDLKAQLRIPLPDLTAAVVQTVEGVYCLADPTADLRWYWCSGIEHGDWCTDADLPRITKVLFPGLDV